MKKLLLSMIFIAVAFTGVEAQVNFEWGTATWNIQDGWVFDGIEEFEQSGVVLTYPNPTGYTLTFLNVVAVEYLVFQDDVEVPDTAASSCQAGTAVALSYHFIEGHSYKIVTTGAALVKANLTTRVTDTLSLNNDSYTISFKINGPELVKTIDVEQNMSLAITDQEDPLTFNLIDTQSVLEALSITSMSEATIYGLRANGAYVSYEWYGPDYFDGWRDADGEYTLWYGGYNRLDGHNAYPAVYSIKLNQTCDSVTYYFYDYWRDYDPEESDTTGGSSIQPTKRRVPDTHYNYQIVEWPDEENDTVYYYRRNYRCDEGQDYKASFAVKGNNRLVRINATLHFLSIEDYEALNAKIPGDVNEDKEVNINDVVAIINVMAGTASWPNANVNGDPDGAVDINDVVAVINIMAGN